MTDRDAEYRSEIIDWLLGRLSRQKQDVAIAPVSRHLKESPKPALLWWLFEGRRYPGLEGSLASNWGWVNRQVRRLLTSYNPVWRLVDSPEGETDWVASAVAALTSTRPVYVSKASRVGLAPEEMEVLLIWLQWIRSHWLTYVHDVGPPPGVSLELPWQDRPERLRFRDETSVRRWAHIARRSRWALLRNIIAETFRIKLEPQDLDQLPLPSEHARLFELYCIARILRTLEPEPHQLRWLDLQNNRNLIQVPGVTCHYQKSFGKDAVINAGRFDESLRDAFRLYNLSVPSQSDAWVSFDRPRNGFTGLLVEFKSGSQAPDTAIYQLLCYREALRHSVPRAVVIWGIVEEDWLDDEGTDSGDQAQQSGVVRSNPPPTNLPILDSITGDKWVFSTASSIPTVLRALELAPQDRTPLHQAI